MMAEEAWALGETKGPGGEPQICHLAAVCAREVSWGNDRQELCMCVCSATSVVSNSMTPCPAARQAPPSMGFSRQEYWSGLPCPAPGDLPDLGIETVSPVCPALAGGFFTAEPPGKPQGHHTLLQLT